MSSGPETRQEPGPLDDEPAGRPWRLGALTLLALLAIVAGVLIVGGTRGQGDDAAPPPAGAELSLPPLPTPVNDTGIAPDFSVDLFDGSRFILGEHLRNDGRPVILNLWASWCFPCRAEMPDLDAAAAAHPEVVILGVAVDDDPVAAEDFADEIEVSYPIGADEGDRVHRRYPAPGLPATFVIGSDGALLHSVFGQLTESDIESLVSLALGES